MTREPTPGTGRDGAPFQRAQPARLAFLLVFAVDRLCSGVNVGDQFLRMTDRRQFRLFHVQPVIRRLAPDRRDAVVAEIGLKAMDAAADRTGPPAIR